MSGQADFRGAASLAHTAFVLSGLIGDRICAIIPEAGEEADDDAVDAVLDDVEQIRLATGRLIDRLIAEYPRFRADYAAHEARMKAASDRHAYARELLILSGEDPDAEGNGKGGAQ